MLAGLFFFSACRAAAAASRARRAAMSTFGGISADTKECKWKAVKEQINNQPEQDQASGNLTRKQRWKDWSRNAFSRSSNGTPIPDLGQKVGDGNRAGSKELDPLLAVLPDARACG